MGRWRMCYLCPIIYRLHEPTSLFNVAEAKDVRLVGYIFLLDIVQPDLGTKTTLSMLHVNV
jgi:hypothetical protein